MKSTSVFSTYLQKIWKYISVFTTSVVSGIPSDKNYFKPRKESTIQVKKEGMKPGFEKHYHRPVSKPVVEKQTLSQEKKKMKSSN